MNASQDLFINSARRHLPPFKYTFNANHKTAFLSGMLFYGIPE